MLLCFIQEVLAQKMKDLQAGEPCGGTCTNDPLSYFGRPLDPNNQETWECALSPDMTKCQCTYSASHDDGNGHVTDQVSTHQWACPTAGTKPWRFVMGRDIDLETYLVECLIPSWVGGTLHTFWSHHWSKVRVMMAGRALLLNRWQ